MNARGEFFRLRQIGQRFGILADVHARRADPSQCIDLLALVFKVGILGDLQPPLCDLQMVSQQALPIQHIRQGTQRLR